jgi:hypothetical protein
MEFPMNRLRILSAATVLALALPAVMPTESFAQAHRHGAAAAPGIGGGGGGAHRGGGAPGPRYGGGGGSGYHHHGGGGGFIPGAIAGAVIGGAIASQSRPYYGGGPAYYSGGPAYYGGGAYDYDDGYAEDPVVQVAPAGGGDDVAYCMQTYRSYDPRSGTYLGNDGYRHPCP